MEEKLLGQVENMTHDGQGVVKVHRFPIFVPGALPGENIFYKIVQKGKKFARGQLLEILEKSPQRQEAKDPTLMAIMPLQILSYPEQVAFKENLVKQAFQRIGVFENLRIQPMKTMDHPWFYRNKLTLAVKNIQGQIEFGIYKRKSHTFIPVNQTYLGEKPLEEAMFKVRDLLRKEEIFNHDSQDEQGNLHHIVVKRGHYTGQVMVIFVTKTKKTLGNSSLYKALKREIPDLVSIAQNIQEKDHQEILGKKTKILWGEKYLQDKLLDLNFYQSPQSFYQVNTTQAEALYQVALDYGNLKGTETVLDAYCGLGTISLHLAQKAKKVYAMDLVQEAILGAKENQKLNQIPNAHFEAGRAEDILPKWQKQGIHFDLAVVDPPRKGLDPKFIQSLEKIGPTKIVYVSCNPATLARDCKLFAEKGYRLDKVQPVDLFCQTPEVENVVLMTRK